MQSTKSISWAPFLRLARSSVGADTRCTITFNGHYAALDPFVPAEHYCNTSSQINGEYLRVAFRAACKPDLNFTLVLFITFVLALDTKVMAVQG